MKKIVFINGKGGTGKTTSAALIASAAAANGLTVRVIDTDPQQSLTAWVKNTEPEGISLEGDCDIIIVDTPPRLDEKKLHGVLSDADQIVVVTTLSPNDALTTERTISLLNDLGLMARSRLLINMFQPGTLLARQEKEILDVLPIRKFKNKLHRRQAYQYAMLHGWAAVPRRDVDEIVKILLELLTNDQ